MMMIHVQAYCFALIIALSCSFAANGQEKKIWSDSKFYSHSNGEFIFSFANATGDDDEKLNTPLRFTCFLHAGEFWNYDPNKVVGFYTGFALRNIGFIARNDSSRMKFRSYSLGIPVAIKIGDLKRGTFIFVGGEYEWLFNYKQKEFIDGKKIKLTEWFSGRTNAFLPSVFAGIQLAGGTQFMYKMYLDNFFNTSFSENRRGIKSKPYENLRAELFYVSVAFNMKNKKLREKMKPESAPASTFTRR